MRVVVRSNNRCVILRPERGDTWVDVLGALHEAGPNMTHGWLLCTPPGGEWVFMPPADNGRKECDDDSDSPNG